MEKSRWKKFKLKNNLEKIDDALILGKSQVVLDVIKDRRDRDFTNKQLPKTSGIRISGVTSLQRTTDIQKAFKKIKREDDLFKPLASFGSGKTAMVNVLKDCISDYGASVWYKRAKRVENNKANEESKWRRVFKVVGRVAAAPISAGLSEAAIAVFGGDKKNNQTIGDMEKEINQKFIKKMDKENKNAATDKPRHDFVMGNTLAAMDENKTEYDYKNLKVTFFVKEGKEAKELGLKSGQKIEVEFKGLTGKFSKKHKNISQNSLKKHGAEFNKFKNERISLAKEMLQDFDSHKDNIKLYEGENKFIEAYWKWFG